MTALQPRRPAFDESSFFARLELIRFELKWSGAQMARFIGVSDGSYNNWIKGRHFNPQIGRDVIARKFRDQHGYDEEWLLHGPPQVAGGTSDLQVSNSGWITAVDRAA